jgi:hypothetical protein
MVMPEWLIKKLGKAGALLLIVAFVLALFVGGYYSVKHYFTAGLDTQVKVGKAQTGAAIESGHQAVETIGNRQAAEANGAATVQEAQHEIDNATDPGGVTDAGISGLHRVRRQEGDRSRR